MYPAPFCFAPARDVSLFRRGFAKDLKNVRPEGVHRARSERWRYVETMVVRDPRVHIVMVSIIGARARGRTIRFDDRDGVSTIGPWGNTRHMPGVCGIGAVASAWGILT